MILGTTTTSNFGIGTDDIVHWPCGTWCTGEQLHEMSHMSDDFEVLRFESPEWQAFYDAAFDDLSDPLLDAIEQVYGAPQF